MGRRRFAANTRSASVVGQFLNSVDLFVPAGLAAIGERRRQAAFRRGRIPVLVFSGGGGERFRREDFEPPPSTACTLPSAAPLRRRRHPGAPPWLVTPGRASASGEGPVVACSTTEASPPRRSPHAGPPPLRHHLLSWDCVDPTRVADLCLSTTFVVASPLSSGGHLSGPKNYRRRAEKGPLVCWDAKPIGRGMTAAAPRTDRLWKDSI